MNDETDNSHLKSLEIFMGHYHLEDNMHYKWIIKRFKELQQENKQLKVNRDEAIEYINNNWDGSSYTDATLKSKVAELNITELLSLLERGKE
jgi:hypothetical protein